ncbi:MAG: hypothetical protein ACOH14_06495 [Rhodoglobus sp.]
MTWFDAVDDDDEAVQELADWLDSLPPLAQVDVVSRITTLEGIASRGEIQVPEDEGTSRDLDAIHSDPDLFELKWTLYTKHIRQYHGEPPQHPGSLIRLHRHIKSDTREFDPNAGQRQQDEIEKAIARYRPSTIGG